MVCKRCNADKPDEAFQARSDRYANGKRDATCKSCRRELAKQRQVEQWGAFDAAHQANNAD